MTTYDEMKAATEIALADPRPGDLYHECYSWWAMVVRVEGPKIGVITLNPPGSMLRDGRPRVFSNRDEFVTYLRHTLLSDRGNNVDGWMPEWPYLGPPACALCAERIRPAGSAR